MKICFNYVDLFVIFFRNNIKLIIYLIGYIYFEERVVRDGNLVISRGFGIVFEFGIEFVRVVRGDDGEVDKLVGLMLIK